MNESTHVGACITLDHLEKVRNHIKGAVAEGAQLLYVSSYVLYIVITNILTGALDENIEFSYLLKVKFDTISGKRCTKKSKNGTLI